MRLSSYPNIYALGHKAIAELLLDPVVVQEKIDGSQFSFGLVDGELSLRSKGTVVYEPSPEKMFLKAVETVQSLNLHPGWVYRAEYLAKPKHNALAYDRIPLNHLIIFDILKAAEDYLSVEEVKKEGERIGLEVVPTLFAGRLDDQENLAGLLETVSVLGGNKVEGVVIKNYYRFGPDKKVLMGKYVSERFKEVHATHWKGANPNSGDVFQGLIESLRTEARWQKAVQHLREKGELQNAPQDIGPLIKEVKSDILKEESDRIKEVLFKWAADKVVRGATSGLPEWYKQQLAKLQFERIKETGDTDE